MSTSDQTSSTMHNDDKKDKKITKRTPDYQSDHDEFQIAADLTLYANPLRCLSKRTAPKPNLENESKRKEEKPEDTGDIIAADLTKYGSPLDDKN
uniref:Uncharacterized protein n=2 Tax=Arion vulgaris TaxID=1028688 RepID=A0A0B6ZMP6_9EUPU